MKTITTTYIWWLAVTFFVPVGAPFVILVVANTTLSMPGLRGIYRTAVKDGQLLWLAVSLAAAALLDATPALRELGQFGPLVVLWFVGLLFFCVSYISIWTVGQLLMPVAGDRFRLRESLMICLSALLLFMTSASYCVLKLAL